LTSDTKLLRTTSEFSVTRNFETWANLFFFSCNWLGGEAVADELNPKNWIRAGYENVTTSDNIVHGQVKQAGNFVSILVERDHASTDNNGPELYQNIRRGP